MSNDSDAVRPETGPQATVWVFRLDRVLTRWDWTSGSPVLSTLQPIRLPNARALSKHAPTHVYSETMRRHLLVESGRERELVEELDGDPQVSWIAPQPCQLHFRSEGRKAVKHIPDLLVIRDGKPTVWDVRPVERQSRKFLDVAEWTRASCESIGWEYSVFGGHPPIRRVNQLWFAAYRRPSPCIEVYADVIRNGIRDGSIATVADVTSKDSGYGQLLAALWHLIWAHRVTCDMDQPLSGATPIGWAD